MPNNFMTGTGHEFWYDQGMSLGMIVLSVAPSSIKSSTYSTSSLSQLPNVLNMIIVSLGFTTNVLIQLMNERTGYYTV
jgi:hypothetical protein